MPTPPVTVLDTLIGDALTDWNLARTTAFAMTAAQAAALNEAPGLISDPVLGPGAPSLLALNLDWQHFFKGNFEVTGHTKILTIQQSMWIGGGRRKPSFVTCRLSCKRRHRQI